MSAAGCTALNIQGSAFLACRIFTTLLEAAQLAAVDLDAVGIAVFGDLALVNLVLSGNGECLRAGDLLLNSFCPECLGNLV
jgi:hypothetical protein